MDSSRSTALLPLAPPPLPPAPPAAPASQPRHGSQSMSALDGPCCPVCLDPFGRRLRPLPLAPCGHALCRPCGRRLLAALPSAARPAPRCPLCRQEYALPPDPLPAPPHVVVVLPVDGGNVAGRARGGRPRGNYAGGDSVDCAGATGARNPVGMAQGDVCAAAGCRATAGGKPARHPVAETWVWTTGRCLPGSRWGAGRTGKGSEGSGVGELSSAAAPLRDSDSDGDCERSGRPGVPGGESDLRLRHVLLIATILLLGLVLFVVGVVLRLRVFGGGSGADAAPTARGPS